MGPKCANVGRLAGYLEASTYHEYGFITRRTFMMELNLVPSHISKVFFSLLRSARTQPLIVLDLPGFGIVCVAFPFLVFWNAVEGFLFFTLGDLSLK